MNSRLSVMLVKAEYDYQSILDIICTGDISDSLISRLDRLGRLIDALYIYCEIHNEVAQ